MQQQIENRTILHMYTKKQSKATHLLGVAVKVQVDHDLLAVRPLEVVARDLAADGQHLPGQQPEHQADRFEALEEQIFTIINIYLSYGKQSIKVIWS